MAETSLENQEASEDAEEKSGTPRERVLEAALVLFVEQGYFNTNIPDISKHSRCSVGSIYHHFLNKEEIASQLYVDGISQFRQAIANNFEADSGLEASIYSLIVAFLSFAESHRLLARYLWLARHDEFLSHKVSKPTMIGYDRLGRSLTRLVKAGIRSGEIPDIKADALWSILFGMPLSFMRDWLDGYTSQTPTQVAPTLARACYGALQAAKSS